MASLPVSARKQGFLTDTQFVTVQQSIAIDRITAPTLVASVKDDHYRTLGSARFIAAAIPHARLITYRTGGHAWVGHDAELFAEVDAFLKDHEHRRPPILTVTPALAPCGQGRPPDACHEKEKRFPPRRRDEMENWSGGPLRSPP